MPVSVRRWYPVRSTAVALATIIGCASAAEPIRTMTRTYRMGFSSLPPRLTVPEVLRTIDSVGRHADGALMVVDVPWKALLEGTVASQLVRRDNLPVAQLFRQHGLPLVATVEPAHGLDRRAESEALVALGRS